jgi:ribosomal protein S18 acetylase RimI-like enzyme
LIEIRKLPADRWKEYRDLRLEALKMEPSAYGSSFEEAKRHKEELWRERIKSVLFALSDDRPVGMVVYVFGEGLKSRHIAEIFGFYVSPDHRGQGVGTRLLERAIAQIRRNRRIIKVKLAVNPEQRTAVRLYQKAGFVVTGSVEKELKVGRKYYGMLFMEKWLMGQRAAQVTKD